jgi:hypothetical protein
MAIGTAAAVAVWAAACGVSAAEEGPRDTPAPIDVSGRLERLGNPLAERYPDGSRFHFARSISDLQHFDGKLYLGHGDWGENSGPTDIWCYDLATREFVNQGRVDDEAADHYRVINGRLCLPGMDPQEDWTLGNFYRLEAGQWVKHRTLPGAVHNFDMLGIDNTLFALTGRLVEQPPCLMVSTDDGQTWQVFDIPAGTRIPPDVYMQHRLLVIGGDVYIAGNVASGDIQVHRFNGTGFDPCTGNLLPGADKPFRDEQGGSWARLAVEKPMVFQGRVLYLGGLHRSIKESNPPWRRETTLELFVATLSGPTEFRADRTLAEGKLTDIAVDDERCYVVSYRWNDPDDPRQGAVTTVFASADLQNWSKLFSYHDETFASALEVVGGDFYLGQGGTREFCAAATGTILKVGKDQLK